MSKTRDTGFLGNVVKVDSNGDISLMHGSTMLMQISSSGAVTTTGVISGSNALTSSYSQNSELLDNLDSTSFVFTSSFNTYSSSMSTRVTNTESTGSTLTSASASLNTASGSFSTRVTRIEGNYATTGSNVFLGAQTVCANITSTGTIIAQTLNVQQVTSSVVYSSGSNVFGCALINTQQFTGSVTMTGSLAVFTAGTTPEFQVVTGGTIKGNALTDIHQATGSLRVTGSGVHFIQGGCVGIGCVSPGYTLDVNGILNVCTSTGSQIRLLNYGGSSAKIRGTQSTLAIEACGAFTVESGGATERLRINENGIACFACQVCIGGELTVNGASININCSNTTNTDARINMYTSNNVNGDRATIYGYNLAGTTGGCEITYLAFGYCSTNVQGYINMQTKSGASWCNTMSLRNGLVGIGTTTPGAKLEVNGAIIGTSVGIGGSPLTELYISSGTMRIDGTTPLIYLRGGSSGAKGAITLNHFGFTDFSINAGCSGNYILGITKTAGGTDGILLYCSGDVGIGISDPQSYSAKLTVAGNIRASLGCAIGVWDSSNTTYVQFSSPSSRNLRITNDAGTEYFRLSNPGIACFAGRVCAPTATIPTLTADQINLTNTVSQTPFGLSATPASTNQDVLSIGNERGVWLVTVSGVGGNNSYFTHSAIVYSAAYEKSFTDLGQANHFGNSVTYFSLSTTSGASAAFRFCSNQSISGGTIYILKLGAQ